MNQAPFSCKEMTLAFRILSLLMFCYTGGEAAPAGPATPPVVISSPDGQLHLAVAAAKGKLTYSVTFNRAVVILPSGLGLVIDGHKLGGHAVLGKVSRYTMEESYPVLGVHSRAANHCQGANIDISSPDAPFRLEVKVFNDGVAFRYIVNKQGPAIVDGDSTEFMLSPGTVVWSQSNIKYYEGAYHKKNIGLFKTGELAGPPATLELPGNAGYAAITEGGLTDFAGMSLVAGGNNGFIANLTGVTHKNGTIESPWRIIEIGRDLNTLVNCDIITNVAPDPEPRLFPPDHLPEWVRPGRSVWSWLTKDHAVTLKNMERFTDLAATLGFEYNLVDEGWGDWKDSSRDRWAIMKELVDYSTPKGVKIWVWKAYPDRNGIPGINTSEKRRAFFQQCKSLGIAGLKIDFFDSESQEIVDFYQDALKDAADYQLMMDFHGANKPTGENRTWPNELTREAIRGLENSPPWAPGNATLPFTRYLAGPADFTPVHFGDHLGEVSWAQQVATMVVFTSPLLCLGADPDEILVNPCKTIIQSVPPTWDETIVLDSSKIGVLALYARRKGTTWFLAGINGSGDTRTLDIPLSFLKKGAYTIASLQDDPRKQAAVLVRNDSLPASRTIRVVMNAFGGYVARIDPVLYGQAGKEVKWAQWNTWGAQKDGTYHNPILPADYSDVDCIRVGADYYAISSTFQYSPGMVILQSKDLVSWTIKGHVVNDLTQISREMNWDRMNRYGKGIWAGAIRYHDNKYWVYFGTPDEGYFMSTAADPAGPWTPLHQVLSSQGWDDCCPFWDDDGQGYLVGTSYKDNYQIHLFKLTADGQEILQASDKIIHQSKGSEANKLYKINGWYYHLFSEVKEEGRVLMMERAKNIGGPYLEVKQLNHAERKYMEPNQGGLVQSEKGDWFFLTHHGTGDWSGRILSLLPVTWINDWPIIGKPGADGAGRMVWSGKLPVEGAPVLYPSTSDDFTASVLPPQWEWNYQPREGKWSLTERPGWLRLQACKPPPPGGLLLAANTLTQRVFRTRQNEVLLKMDISGMTDGQSTGLAHFGSPAYAAVGITRKDALRKLEYKDKDKTVSGPTLHRSFIWLKSAWGLDGRSQFSYSEDGRSFIPFGPLYQLQWGSYRGDRIALYNYNDKEDSGAVDVDFIHYTFR